MQGDWTKDSYEFQFMGDFYKLCKEFYLPEKNNEYWDKLVKATCGLCNKYGNTPFVLNMTMGFVNYAEEAYKKASYGIEIDRNSEFKKTVEKIIKAEKGKA